MKGFKLDATGDIVFENEGIAMIKDIELKAQTLRTVMGTDKGEWFLNEDEGVDFGFLNGKGITDDMRMAQCTEACRQVDANLHVLDFHSEENKKTREASIYFEAQDEAGAVVAVNQSYGVSIAESNADASSKLALANAQLAAGRGAVTKLERRLSGQ